METQHKILVVLIVVMIVGHSLRKVCNTSRIRLLTDANGNESLIMIGTMSGVPMYFMIDTAYAGAPVLSTSYMALPTQSSLMSHEERYRHILDDLHVLTPDDRHEALARFLSRNKCRSFTSGCTMRLMGIGTTSETQTDLLLCEKVRFSGCHVFRSDVFVTNPLPSSVHILTMDFLLHRSPCVMMPRHGTILWQLNDPFLKASFEFHSPVYVGGAMRVPMTIGGSSLDIVIDTGAAAALSISHSAIDRLQVCEILGPSRKALQMGVNGERICSDVFSTSVSVGNINLGRVETFANSDDVEGADGYAGMGLLRMLDMWIAAHEIGFRLSGLPARGSNVLSLGRCRKNTTLKCIQTTTKSNS